MEENDQNPKNIDFNDDIKYLLNESGTILY